MAVKQQPTTASVGRAKVVSVTARKGYLQYFHHFHFHHHLLVKEEEYVPPIDSQEDYSFLLPPHEGLDLDQALTACHTLYHPAPHPHFHNLH